MNFELINDAMLNEALAEDVSYDFRGGTLDLDDVANPPDEKAVKREQSWSNLLPCVSDLSDDDYTGDERDELQDFLKDVGILETPVLAPAPKPSPESFECWGVTISSVAEEQHVEPVGTTPFTFYPVQQQGQVTFPPQKRRRMHMPSSNPAPKPVTPTAANKAPVSLMPMPLHGMPPIMSPAATPPTKKGKGIGKEKNRTTRQFVPFKEMQRLMTEYGPIITPRKRKIKDKSDETKEGVLKAESVKRKFYRWFPDFEDRFVKNPDGFTYRPKVGHDNEKAYRLAMRNMDQEILNHKRKVGRKCESP
jgi:hypothetical protein